MDTTLNRPAAAGPAPPVERPMSRQAVLAGRGLSTIIVLLLTLDSVGKLLRVPQVLDGTAQLGFATSLVVPLGLIQLLCIVAYVVPATSFLGAVLLTGYLGGAVATHVRLGNPLLTHVLSPVYVGVVVWLGLALRDARLRALLGRRAA